MAYETPYIAKVLAEVRRTKPMLRFTSPFGLLANTVQIARRRAERLDVVGVADVVRRRSFLNTI